MSKKFEIKEFVEKYRSYFFQYLQVILGSLPASMCPALTFTDGEDCCTDGNSIRIGREFIKAKDEDTAILETLYVLEHEAQHVLSSPNKYWMWGVERGAEMLGKELCSLVYGVVPVPQDLNKYYERLRKDGYRITPTFLTKISHFVLNSVEDGRIESIRCRISRIFRDEMFVYRIGYWEKNGIEENTEDFTVILNQILSLATMGIYQKNYHETYSGTKVDECVDALLPYIANAVKARSCKECAIAITGMYKILAPWLLEYSKGNNENDFASYVRSTGQSGANEANSYGGASNTEVYNEGEQNEEESKTDGSSSGKGKSNKGDSEDEDKSKTGSGKSSNDESSQPNSNSSADADDASVNNPSENGPLGELRKTKGFDNLPEIPEEGQTFDEDAFNKMMEEAKNRALEAAKENAKDVNSYGYRKRPTIKEVFDTSAPVTSAILKKKGSKKFSFTEIKRDYPVSVPMPQILAQRANAFARKLEKVFEQENIPELGNRLSGKVNTSDLYKLAIGEMDFWKKEEEEGDLDTCVYLLCDNSGSMGDGKGSKRQYALETLSVIEEGFKKYVPLKIATFTEYGCGGIKVVHSCVKGWKERLNQNCAFNYLINTCSDSGNADGCSIRVATAELMERPESKKILLVLSDGLPAYHDGENDTALAAEEARQQGIILVPIYFGCSSCDDVADLNTSEAKRFAKMYKKDFIVTIPEDVEDAVIKVLTRLVLNCR